MEKNRIMEISNEEKATEFANYFAGETDYKENAAYSAAMAMADWKDEWFAEEKKEIDEQWKRLMAESKSIGVDLLQRKDEQHKQEKQKLIDEACEWWTNNWRKYVMTDRDGIVALCFWKDDFKKAMKGE